MPAAAVHSFEQWRNTARQLLAQQVLPDQIVWSDARQPTLFEAAAAPECATSVAALTIPRKLRQLLQDLACYRDAGRWELMYRLSWRVLHEQRELLDNEADADVRTAQSWQQSVHHDVHRMHAFVRFHELAAEDGLQYVAWFEPRHEILRGAVPFFEKRFPNMRWMIATPDGAAAWDGCQTQYIESPPRASLPREDQTHGLWRTYYRNICNAARINPQLMRQHMPGRYWQHLPEASQIKPLIAEGHRRTQQALAAVSPPDNLLTPRGITASLAGLAVPDDSLMSCRRCELWRHATQAVLGEGPRNAAIMLVGEQPGDEEDLGGRPFIGPAGQKLDQLLLRAGLDRRRLYVTNAVKHFKWQPRGKRRLHQRPDQQELRACHAWLEQEITAISPRIIVALGATAIRAVTGLSCSVEQARLEPFALSAHTQVVCSYHPSAILRAEGARQVMLSEALEQDLRAALAMVTADSPHATGSTASTNAMRAADALGPSMR